MDQKFALITIGDELLKGIISDKNGSWLGKRLTELGIGLGYQSVIGDDSILIHEQIRNLSETFDVIILSGGLGPTQDDITKHSLASLYESKITKNIDVYKMVDSHYKRVGKDFKNELNEYDLFPEFFTPLKNPAGLAPGLFYKDEKSKTKIFALPGVPREFQEMFNQSVLPLLENDKKITTERLLIRTFKVPEEKIFGVIDTTLWEKLSAFGKISSLPHIMGVDIGVDFFEHINWSESKEKIKLLLKDSPLLPHIWSIGSESLEQKIINLAKIKNLTIGFCESCTGGLTSSQITNIAGSSSVFMGSVISYSNDIKIKILNVNPQTLSEYGAVSEQCAIEMAIGGKKVLGVDYCVSFTGIAGPDGGTKEKPVGTIGIGIAGPDGTSSEVFHLKGDRIQLKERFMKQGLHLLLSQLDR